MASADAQSSDSIQLEQLRLGPGGRPRGEGSLYALGLNSSMTGVFYNKKLAAQAGMTAPPATLAELDQALEKAESAGVTPILQFNGGATSTSRCRATSASF